MAQTTRHALFGPVLTIATFHIVYFITYNLYVVVGINKIERKNLLTAQTTHHALFGPDVVVAIFLVVYFISYNPYVVISINKTRRKEKTY